MDEGMPSLSKLGERRVKISELEDALIAEFNTRDLLSSVKSLFYMMIQRWTLSFFVNDGGKYVRIWDISEACQEAKSMSVCGTVHLDKFIAIKNAIYRMIWPDKPYDTENASLLDVCMDIIKKKC